MVDNTDDDLTRAEREAYASLRDDAGPPPVLEDRVVAALRAQGLLGRRRGLGGAAWGRWAAALAAGALLFITGSWFGQWQRPGPAPAGARQYMLLLHEDRDYDQPPPDQSEHRVDEYRQWAATLGHAGRLVAGEKLGSEGSVLFRGGGEGDIQSSDLAADDTIAGFFIITADSDDIALALARSCPHLLHGGRIEIRPIEPG